MCSTDVRASGSSPDNNAEIEEARSMAAAVDQLDHLGLPRGLRAAVAHALHAAALELNNGRPLPLEVRRAARHLVEEINQAALGSAV
jgi:hypothetical protein